jgi:hypothetical protein
VFEHIADFIQLRGLRPRDVIVVCRAANDHLVSFETDLLRFSVAQDVCLEETNLLSAILVLRSQSYGTAVGNEVLVCTSCHVAQSLQTDRLRALTEMDMRVSGHVNVVQIFILEIQATLSVLYKGLS